MVDDIPMIKDGYRGFLFDFLDRWYNVLKVYNDEKFVGYYSDIRTLPERIPGGYQATDLVLDLWVWRDGEYTVLDRDEFRDAPLEEMHRKKAEAVLWELTKLVREGKYPPKIVEDISANIV